MAMASVIVKQAHLLFNPRNSVEQRHERDFDGPAQWSVHCENQIKGSGGRDRAQDQSRENDLGPFVLLINAFFRLDSGSASSGGCGEERFGHSGSCWTLPRNTQ
jgi:hypothetical protein